jgi:SpoVK/Ycf46/Vps4 family AAA+-type ATPase
MNLDQCLGANRPLIFVTCESDVEVLRHVSKNYPENAFFVYSTTLAKTVNLTQFLNPKRSWGSNDEAQSTLMVLDNILSHHGYNASQGNKTKWSGFATYIFLDCDAYIGDPQIIRKIKDILFKYTIDEEFTINLLMVSNKVCVPPALERLSEIVFYDLPSEKELKTLSNAIAKKLEMTGDKAPSEEVENNIKGLTTFEVEQAYLQSHYLYKKVDINFIRDFKKNSIAKTDLLSLLETTVSFNNIGGLDRLKAWIKKSAGGWTVEGKKYGLPLLKGILMVGIPGCGKTTTAKAIGNEWGLPVVDFDPSKIFTSRVGDSESNMRRVLQIVNTLSPCILFIDEIEKGLAGLQSSSYSDSGVTARVIRSFLIWMQENPLPVFTVATANSISNLPPELIGRFNEVFFVNLPQVAERKDIFSIHIKKLNREPKKFDLDALATKSIDLSGREIEQALNDAMYDSFHAGVDLNSDAILKVLNKKTSLVATMAEQINSLKKWVGWDKEKSDGLRAKFASTPDPDDLSRMQSAIDDLIKEVENKPLSNGDQGVGGM